MSNQNDNKERIKGLKEALRAICNREPQYEPLWANYIATSIDSGDRVNLSPSNFPNYTRHDDKHSRAVLSKMEMLIGEGRLASLGATDVWLLLMCAYTHDYGMLVSIADIKQHLDNGKLQDHYERLKNEKHSTYTEAAHALDFNEMEKKIRGLAEQLAKKVPYNDEKDNKDIRYAELINAMQTQKSTMLLLQSYFRNSHAGGYRLSLANCISDGIDIRLHNLVASIDEAHTKEWSAVMRLPYETDGFATDHAHPRFAAVMLRLADLLDIDASRINPYQVRLTINGNESMAHQERSLAVESILTNPKNVGAHFNFKETEMIKRYAEYGNGSEFNIISEDRKKDSDINNTRYLATRLAFDWYEMLKEELKNFALNWNDIVCSGYAGSAPQIREEDFSVKINGEMITTEDLDLRYELSNKRAYEIIRGSGIYNDKLTFIRELVQNAIDATKIQMFIDWENSPSRNRRINSKDLTPEEFIAQLPYDVNNKAIIITVEKKANANGLVNCELHVDDFGTGISSEKLKKLKYVGNIYDPETERVKRLMPEWLKPTGAFGIGLQSVFQFTKRFEMNTFSTFKNESLKIIFDSTETDGIIFPQKAEGGDRRKISGTKVIVPLDELLESINNEKNYADIDLLTDKAEPAWHHICNYLNSIGGVDIVPVILRKKTAAVDKPEDEIIISSIFEDAFPKEYHQLCGIRNKINLHYNSDHNTNMNITFKFRTERYEEYSIQDIIKDDIKKIIKYRFWYWSKTYNILVKLYFIEDVYKDQITNLFSDHKNICGNGDFVFRGINVVPSKPDIIPYYNWEKIHTAWCDACFHIMREETDNVLCINRDRLLEESEEVKNIKKDSQEVLLDAFTEILLLYKKEKIRDNPNNNFYKFVNNNKNVVFLLILAADCIIKRALILSDKGNVKQQQAQRSYIDSKSVYIFNEIKEDLLEVLSSNTEIEVAFFDRRAGKIVEKKNKSIVECLKATDNVWFCDENIKTDQYINDIDGEDTIMFFPDILTSYPIRLYWSEVIFALKDGFGKPLIPIYKYCVIPRKVIKLNEEDIKLIMQQSYIYGELWSELKKIKEKYKEEEIWQAENHTESRIENEKNEKEEREKKETDLKKAKQNEKKLKELQNFFGTRHVFPAFNDFEKIAVPYDPSVCPESLKNCGYVILSPIINKMFIKTNDKKSIIEDIREEYNSKNITIFEEHIKKILCEDEHSGNDIYGFRELIRYVADKNYDNKEKTSQDEYVNEYLRFIQIYMKNSPEKKKHNL